MIKLELQEILEENLKQLPVEVIGEIVEYAWEPLDQMVLKYAPLNMTQFENMFEGFTRDCKFTEKGRKEGEKVWRAFAHWKKQNASNTGGI